MLNNKISFLFCKWIFQPNLTVLKNKYMFHLREEAIYYSIHSFPFSTGRSQGNPLAPMCSQNKEEIPCSLDISHKKKPSYPILSLFPGSQIGLPVLLACSIPAWSTWLTETAFSVPILVFSLSSPKVHHIVFLP